MELKRDRGSHTGAVRARSCPHDGSRRGLAAREVYQRNSNPRMDHTHFKIEVAGCAYECPDPARVPAKKLDISAERFDWHNYATNSGATGLLSVSPRANLLMRKLLCIR